jgi:23S rRNA (cytosine1962-C5)-methyltransferase
MKKIYLKQDKEKPVLRRHPWIFSGAIQKKDPDIAPGEIVSVCSSNGRHLGYGYYNRATPIAVRLLSFGSKKVDEEYLRRLIGEAIDKRTGNSLLRHSDSCRLIFSEGDNLPGLIVDAYGRHLVLQSATRGIERMKGAIASILIDVLRPESIYERSEHEGRALEGMKPVNGQMYGTTPAEIVMHEKDMSFGVDVREGQKTGFYLDQRDNRDLVRRLSREADVLNLFCYTGGFSVAAARGGARTTTSVDASGDAIEKAGKNMELNRLQTPAEFIKADVFDYLRSEDVTQNLIIIDPPALAKKKSSVQNACRGYKDLHLQIASKCGKNTLVLTCSCSRFISMELFQMVIFEACADAGRSASIIGKYHQPCDHPTSIFCPETEYLKTILLRLD